ncbi:MAG: NAD(P)H-hydrate dehydratase [Dehalococcoidia bacterium]
MTEPITGELVRALLPERPVNANKGTFGRVLVVAGSINYIGAAYLACEGALRVGAGLVTLATPRSLQSILASKLTEVTYIPLPEPESGVIGAGVVQVIREQLPNYNTMLLGCGLGQGLTTVEFVKALLFTEALNVPLVIDADALNIISRFEKWWESLKGKAVLTPHPGEMARLTNKPIRDIQASREETAVKAASEWNQAVILKGAYTVVASPEGKVRVSDFANPGLASAGTGDVLAGAVVGLLAQKMSTFDAATCGVYLHAMAGELVGEELGEAGMVASDLLPRLPLTIKRLITREDR